MNGEMKNRVLMVVNTLLLILLGIQAVTAILSVSGLGGGWNYRIHTTGGFVMVLVAIIHLVLNFGWIRARFSRKQDNR